MARIALISDIHGNQVAFEAVLADLEAQQPDQIICLGDVIASGASPRAVLDMLRGLGLPTVMGNTDLRLLNENGPTEAATDDRLRRIHDIFRWGAAQLTPDDRAYLRTFQPTIRVPLGDGAAMLCFHGSPRSNIENITASTPDEELDAMFEGHQALVYVGGHTHIQLYRPYRDGIILNAGSVGLPIEIYLHGRISQPLRADYAIVTWSDGRLGIELRRVPYRAEALRRAVLESDMPHMEWYLHHWAMA